MTGNIKRAMRWGKVAILALALIGITGTFSDITAINQTKAEPESLLGNYLAGRFAKSQRDSKTAADYYGKALARDPKNDRILEQTFMLAASTGSFEEALELAEKVIKSTPDHRAARYVLAARAFKSGDFDGADAHLSKVRSAPVDELTTRLARAWISLAKGEPDAAFERLATAKKAEWSEYYQLYHKGLIADLAGRPKVAQEAYAKAFKKNPRTLRLAQAYAQSAMSAKNTKLARRILGTHIGRSSGHPLTKALLADIESGKPVGILMQNAGMGIAEVFYGIGDALTGEGGFEPGTIYLQIARYMRPEFPLANVALGEVYESSEKYDLSIKVYDSILEESPLWMNTQVRKAFSLNSLKRVDDAKALLDMLADKFPKETRPLNALGNILRSHKRYAEAIEYYSRAIALIEKPTKAHWRLYYARGVCYEREKNWPKAEADLEKALSLDGSQSLVLNYLGYSWVDQGKNLERAMGLIRKAVKLKPDDGYFVDSLGWAYYRLGDFDKAVEHLERAVELRPDDPVINDHLGDAYWHVGRREEAKYQWTQSLTLKPEPDDAKKTRTKLADGLKDAQQTKAEVEKDEPETKAPN